MQQRGDSVALKYSDSGVDIEAGDRFSEFIRSINHANAEGTNVPGGFASGFAVDCSAYKNPMVLTTTDGVGTKLLVAKKIGRYDTVGIDLVAMCVNDLVVHGARPIDFLDYIACGSLDRAILDPVIEGVIRGCELAGCRLAGGETAEMPDAYAEGDIDLAGFAVGIAERDSMLPVPGGVVSGCKIYGLPSSGVHSNGFSLIRNVIDQDEKALYEELLTPTRIYVNEVLDLIDTGSVAAFAHITGGGLVGNISRILPARTSPELTYDWPVPAIFETIQNRGDIDEEEMRNVFNLGIGMAIVAAEHEESRFETAAENLGIECFEIGSVKGV